MTTHPLHSWGDVARAREAFGRRAVEVVQVVTDLGAGPSYRYEHPTSAGVLLQLAVAADALAHDLQVDYVTPEGWRRDPEPSPYAFRIGADGQVYGGHRRRPDPAQNRYRFDVEWLDDYDRPTYS